MFPITRLDALLIVERGLPSLGREERRRAYERAERIDLALRRLVPGWRPPYRLYEAGDEEMEAGMERIEAPCPLLGEDGLCLIYRFRPKVCRLQGLIQRDPATGWTMRDFCHDPEKGRSELSPIPPQPFDFWRFTEAELELVGSVAAAYPEREISLQQTMVLGAVMSARRL